MRTKADISVFDFDSTMCFIRALMAERATRNRSYSLRAFARDCGTSAAYVSEYLRGKRKLSQEKAALIVRRLGLGESESEYFLALQASELAADPAKKEHIREKARSLAHKAMEIASRVHVLQEVAETQDAVFSFGSGPSSVAEVNAAVREFTERLIRIGERHPPGKSAYQVRVKLLKSKSN